MATPIMEYPKSDHFDGVRFFNPAAPKPHGPGDLARWRATRKVQPWPKFVFNTAKPCVAGQVAPGTAVVTWIGHASFLIQLSGGINILTDPVFSERVSPVSWAGPKRVRAPGISIDELPPISMVLVSHNHYDHMDLPSLRAIESKHSPQFVTTLGNRRFLELEGLRRVVELDWWDRSAASSQMPVSILCTPAQHFSARGLSDRNKTLWAGFVIETAVGEKVFVAADSGYGPHYPEIGKRCGPFGLSLLPIGAYEPRWFMKVLHMNPAEALQAHADVRSRQSVGMHFGTFALADDAFDQPLKDLSAAKIAAGVGDEAFHTLEVGETRTYWIS